VVGCKIERDSECVHVCASERSSVKLREKKRERLSVFLRERECVCVCLHLLWNRWRLWDGWSRSNWNESSSTILIRCANFIPRNGVKVIVSSKSRSQMNVTVEVYVWNPPRNPHSTILFGYRDRLGNRTKPLVSKQE